MARKFDLLGDPIPDNHGKAGANGHVATSKNVSKVRLLVVARWTSKQIADELGVSVPTLNKHYFKNTSIKRARQVVVSEAKGRVLLNLQAAADAGNVSANKEMLKMLEKEELRILGDEMAPQSKTTSQKPLGKKAQRKMDARTPDPDGDWAFLPGMKGTAH